MRRLAFVLVLSALTVCAQAPAGAGPNLYSKQKESALGAQLAREIQRNSTPVNNPAALAYVQQMGAKLAAGMPPQFPFTFALIEKVQNDPTRGEPISLPGGFIFVPTTLFLDARDDSEFAGALAHAMAHVVARHGTRQATKAELGQLTTIPLIFYNGDLDQRRSSSAPVPISMIQFSRAYENEADTIAVKALSDAGYDPGGLARFINHELPDTTPDKSARIAAIEKTITTLPPPPASDEFRQIQAEIRRQNRN